MDHETDSNTNRSDSVYCVVEQVLNSTRDGLVDSQFIHVFEKGISKSRCLPTKNGARYLRGR